MVRGLISNWKCILNYFVSETNISGENLSKILLKNLEIASNLALNVKAIICDQGPNNRKCLGILGVTKEKPYFMFKEQQIFSFYDIPHIIKSMRNTLLNSDLVTPDGIVSFTPVRKLYDLEKNSTTKMCPKLTQKHIDPSSFDKMRVVYAVQVFSRTTSAALLTAVETGNFVENDKVVVQSTAKCFKKIDRIFDCMNSGSLYDRNAYKSALKMKNLVYNYIEDFIEYVKNIRLVKKTKVYWIAGLEQTLRATLMMAEQMFNENEGIDFVLTKRLNQDIIENLFSQIRAKGGNTKNPSVHELNFLISKIMTTNLYCFSKFANCSNDEEQMISLTSLMTEADNNSEFHNEEVVIEKDVQLNEKFDDNYIEAIYETMENDLMLDEIGSGSYVSTEVTSMRYFVGYVAFKVFSNLGCEECLQGCRKKDEVLTCGSEMFIFAKNYLKNSDFGNLFAPTDEFFNVCRIHILIFRQVFDYEKNMDTIKEKIVEKCINNKREENVSWFERESVCYHHRVKALEFMTHVLLRKHCLWYTRKFKKPSIDKAKIIKD